MPFDCQEGISGELDQRIKASSRPGILRDDSRRHDPHRLAASELPNWEPIRFQTAAHQPIATDRETAILDTTASPLLLLTSTSPSSFPLVAANDMSLIQQVILHPYLSQTVSPFRNLPPRRVPRLARPLRESQSTETSLFPHLPCSCLRWQKAHADPCSHLFSSASGRQPLVETRRTARFSMRLASWPGTSTARVPPS